MRTMARPPGDAPGDVTTFIVRVSLDESGELQGIVERAATGFKLRFRRAAELGGVLRQLVAAKPDARHDDACGSPPRARRKR